MPMTENHPLVFSMPALDAAAVNNWTVVDMKRDWKATFPADKH